MVWSTPVSGAGICEDGQFFAPLDGQIDILEGMNLSGLVTSSFGQAGSRRTCRYAGQT